MTSSALPHKRMVSHRIGGFFREHWRAMVVVLALWGGLNLLLGYLLTPPGQAVLNVAYSYPDGGGYCPLNDTGVAHTIKHNGETILLGSKNHNFYCCGFTFAVAMQVAEQRGLLDGKSVWQLRQFQQEWYGAARGSALKQSAKAVVDLGIGREVPLMQAESGDIVKLAWANGGHSVVFLNWIRDDNGIVIGMRYRSSQPGTDGVADSFAYFAGTGYGEVLRKQTFVARLDRPWWSYILHPYG